MNQVVLFGIIAMLVCFGVANFFLSRIPSDIYNNEYDKDLDPLLPVFGTMLLGGLGVFLFSSSQYDNIKNYNFMDFVLPFIFGGAIYFCYLIDLKIITNIVILISSLIMSFIQPDDFCLSLGNLSIWQERLIVAIIIFTITKGMGLLNGIGGIATMQFMAVCIAIVVLAYFEAIPLLLAYCALAYLGVMLAFIFYSWPPEKLVITNGGWNALGFVLASMMLYSSVEYAEVSMIIASSYLLTEVFFTLYNRIILNQIVEIPYMHTSYYKISNDGGYALPVANGILKIFFIDTLLATFQVVAEERIALFIFSIAINLWLLQIIKGDAQPLLFFSVTKWGTKAVKGMFENKIQIMKTLIKLKK